MNINNDQLWKNIEKDKSKYKAFLMLSMIAWVAAIGALGYIGYMFYLEYLEIHKSYSVGLAKDIDLYQAKTNIYTVVLSISIIVACLSSIVVVMRQRSASLLDIQLRLALVEQHISDIADSNKKAR
jgi:nitrate reductase NapE component